MFTEDIQNEDFKKLALLCVKCDNHCEDMLEVHSNSGKYTICNVIPVKI